MRRIILAAALGAMLLATLPAAVEAQTAPSVAYPTQTQAGYTLPWNGLVPSRTVGAYTTIIGKPGTIQVPGSAAAAPYGPTFALPLPFAVEFLNTLYPAGTPVHVAVSGFLSFSPQATSGTAPYLLVPDAALNAMIFPYWSDLGTSGLPGEGIYHRLDVDGTTLDSTWTIEWSVETMSAPMAQGRFQLQIIRRGPWASLPTPEIEIIFNYDRTSPLARPIPPGHYGAQIGVKNVGQYVGNPGPLGYGADDGKYLLFTPSSFAAPAITRLPTRYAMSQNYSPDWYAEATTPYSSYFHYTFPDSSLKMKPIDADASCVRLSVPIFGAASVYPPGTPVIDSVHVINHGLTELVKVPVSIHFVRGGKEVATHDTVIDKLPARDTVAIPFSFRGQESGMYWTVAAVNASGDENHANDTAAWRTYIRPKVDLAAVELAQPVLGRNPKTRYTPQSDVPIRLRVANIGLDTARRAVRWVEIRDTGGVVVFSNIDSTGFTPPAPGEEGVVDFPSWRPTRPGFYYSYAAVVPDGDQIAGNDTLPSVPRADWAIRGTTQEARRPAPMPIIVYPSVERTATPEFYPHMPHAGDTIRGTSPVMAMFTNQGATDALDLKAHVWILAPNGSKVYDRDMTIPSIAWGGGVRLQSFPDFTPSTSGRYRAVAFVSLANGDLAPENDSTSWFFYVSMPDTSSAVAMDGAGADKAGLEVLPRPAMDRATIRWSVARAGRLRIAVTDMTGAEVLARAIETIGGEGAMALDLSTLASGIYMVRLEGPTGSLSAAPLVIQR